MAHDDGSDLDDDFDVDLDVPKRASKGKGKTKIARRNKTKKDDSETDSDVGISKGEAWKLREAKGKPKGENAGKGLDQDQDEDAGKDGKGQGDTPKSNKPTGKIVTWKPDKQFGFIAQDSGGDNLFFHSSSLKCSDKMMACRFLDKHAYEKLAVSFSIIEQMGRTKAKSTKIIDARWKKALAEEWENPGWLSTGIGGEDGGEGSKRKDRNADGDEAGQPRQKESRGEENVEPVSIPQWVKAQERLFGHLGSLPANWIRIRSKSSGKEYFYNTQTGNSSFDEPTDRKTFEY